MTASNVPFLHLQGKDLQPTGSPPAAGIAVGLGSGVAFAPLQTSETIYSALVASNVTLGTGLTFQLLVADDVNNPGPGLVGAFGITVGPITSGTSTYDENSTTGPLVSCTEVTGTVTMPSTPGVVKALSIAVPVADMNSLATNGWCLIRVRRLGASSSDTHRGRIVLLAVDVKDT